MAKKRISERELKAIVDSEIRSAMGEIGGELADDRSDALDYYHGEPAGKLAAVSDDRSQVILTTVRDTVEWMMPQLMRMFAHADSVVEFEPVGQEDEEAAEQETQAINHIFWRQNEGFLILYTWFKDALLQKNGVVKYWLDSSESKTREEYDGLTQFSLAKMRMDPELTPKEFELSKATSIDGQPLFHVVYERHRKSKTIKVMVIPPEEFLISADAQSLDINNDPPRFCAHKTEKTASELREMGFSEADIEEMSKSSEDSDDFEEEHIARYNLTDEEEVGHEYEHESQKKIEFYECYMHLDKNGDGYSELLRVYKAGDFVEAEETDHFPFAAITPTLMSHRFFGQSIYDVTKDLQEISTGLLRNVMDNLYQVNNMRPVVNDRVDLDSLLTSKPGAPIYVEDNQPVGDAILPFAPPPMWEKALGLLEYMDAIRKDRTGVGDETMGLDPSTLANANTGVVLQAMEAAQAKIELVARLFAETGIKWLFRGIHELARKSYDQTLRYKLRNQYVEISPTEWRERTNITVNVGTATGNQQRKLFALTQIAQIQEKMVQGGMMGITLLPQHLYETGKQMAECLGEVDGDQYFMDPMLRANPQFQQIAQIQMPQPQPDAQMEGIKLMAQVEAGKAQIQREKNELEARAKEVDLMLKNKELELKVQEAQAKTQLEGLKQDIELAKAASEEMSTEQKNAFDVALDMAKQQSDHQIGLLKAEIERYKAELDFIKAQATADAGFKERDMSMKEEKHKAEMNERKQGQKDSENLNGVITQLRAKLDEMTKAAQRPKVIKRDKEGRPISIGDKPVIYNQDGTIAQIG